MKFKLRILFYIFDLYWTRKKQLFNYSQKLKASTLFHSYFRHKFISFSTIPTLFQIRELHTKNKEPALNMNIFYVYSFTLNNVLIQKFHAFSLSNEN